MRIARFLPTAFLAILSVAAVCAVLVRGNQLNDLRTEEQRRSASRENRSEDGETGGANQTEGVAPDLATAMPHVSPELLRLRHEVTQLIGRRRELASVRA